MVNSLQRLLSLDQHENDIEKQLCEIADIVAFKSDSNISRDQPSTAVPNTRIHAREEWVIAWLLKKLAHGGHWRASHKAWDTLLYLLQTLPVSVIGRNCSITNLPAILESTLSESFGENLGASHHGLDPSKPKNEKDLVERCQNVIDCASQSDVVSDKRRLLNDDESIKASEVNLYNCRNQDPCALLISVDRVLTKLLSPSPGDNISLPSSVGRLALKSDCDRASRIFAAWLNAVRLCLSIDEKRISDYWKSSTLGSVKAIWSLRSYTTADDEVNPRLTWAKICTLPAARLLVHIQRSKNVSYSRLGHMVSETLNDVEHVLVKNVLMPEHMAFFGRKSQIHGRRGIDSKPTYCVEQSLLELHAMVKMSMDPQQWKANPDARLLDILPILPELLRLSFKGDLVTVREKNKKDRSWNEALFISLCRAIGLSMARDDVSEIPDLLLVCVEEMLAVLIQLKVHLTSDTARILLTNYSGLKDKPSQTVRWKLVMQVISLNRAFLSSAPVRKSLALAKEVQPADIVEILFQKVSEYSSFHCSSGPAIYKSTCFEEVETTVLMDSIILPIMEGFVLKNKLINFVTLWHKAICQEREFASKEPSFITSSLFWESGSLNKALEQHMTRVLNASIIGKILEKLSEPISQIMNSENEASTNTASLDQLTVDSLSSLYLVASVLKALQSSSQSAAILPAVSSCFSLFQSFVLSLPQRLEHKTVHVWRILDLSRNLLAKNKEKSENPSPASAQGTLIEKAISCCQNFLLDSNLQSYNAEAYQCTFTAFSFAAFATNSLTEGDAMRASSNARVLVDIVNARLSQVVEKISKNTESVISWDGNFSQIGSWFQCNLAVSSLICQFPDLLRYCSPQSRQDFLRSLRVLSCHSKSNYSREKVLTGSSDSVTFSTLMRNLTETFIERMPQTFREDLLYVITEAYAPLHDSSYNELPLIPTFATILLHTSTLSREKREVIAMKATQVLHVERLDSEEDIQATMSMFLLFYKYLNANPFEIQHLQQVKDQMEKLKTIPTVDTLNLFEQLGDAMLERCGHLLLHATPSYVDNVRRVFSEIETHTSKKSLMTDIIMLSCALRHLKSNQTNALAFKSDPVNLLLHQFALLQRYEAKNGPLLDEYWKYFLRLQAAFDESVIEDSRLSVIKDFFRQKSHDPGFGTMLSSTTASPLQGDAYRTFVDDWVKLTGSITSPRQHCEALKLLNSKILSLDEIRLNELALCNLKDLSSNLTSGAASLLLSMLHIWKGRPEDREIIRNLLSSIVRVCCTHLRDTPRIQDHYLMFRVIEMILVEKGNCLSQWAIECIVSIVAFLASSSSPAYEPSQGSALFHRLCSVMQTLVLLHRKRFHGRFHLLLQAIEALLSCIFWPDVQHQQNAIPQPRWISAGDSPLPPRQVEAFSRILTTLCDPSMSSVQGHGKIRKSGLVDESRKAKKYAAQFVGYIIQAFCRYQLACPIAPATRDAVMPGLFAVLDIMDPSAKQALNAILDGPARSIWKSLYGEWKMATQWRES